MTLERKKADLKVKGVLLTIQRSAVLDYLHGNTQHPTAEEIYQTLIGTYPALSRATVYNTLGLFKQQGLVQEITIERGKAHYDSNTALHHHFYCRHCGKIYDVAPEKIHVAYEACMDGHQMEEAQLYIIGTCSACRKERLNA